MAAGAVLTVRLKIPPTWRKPPLYVPHPDSLLPLQRCVWCLCVLDPNCPAKLRKCPICGKHGMTAEPLIFRTIYVEQCLSRKERKNGKAPA